MLKSKFIFGKYTSIVFLLVCFCFIIASKNAMALTLSPVRTELNGDPGRTITSQIKVVNSTASSKTYFTNVYTFEAGDENGNPVFRIAKTGLASWINVNEVTTLGPYESKLVPFTVVIPKDSEPGGYFASVFFSEIPPKHTEEGLVSVDSELGELVLLRVNGDFKEGADILEFDTVTHKRVFSSLPIAFYYRFQNSGQSWVKPLGDIIIKNIFGRTSAVLMANKKEGNVLPQSIRRFESTWGEAIGAKPSGFWKTVWFQVRNFAFGPYKAQLNLAYGSQALQSATASFNVWVFPWQLLLVLLGAGILLFFIFGKSIGRYNRWIISRAMPVPKRRSKK